MHQSLRFIWLIGVWVAIVLAGWRWQIERRYRTVALTLDGAEVRMLCAISGRPLPALLTDLRQAGVTAVAVSAETLRDWIASGKVFVVSANPPTLAAPSLELLERLRRALMQQWGVTVAAAQRHGAMWFLTLPAADLLDLPLPLGLDRQLADAVRDAGLSVVARLPNPPGLTDRGVRFWMDEVRQCGAFAVMFDGEEVFGYRTMLDAAAQALRQTGCLVGILELTSQKGDRALAKGLADRVVRVHSVSPRELPNFTLPELIDRFTRAVRERNARLCYIRVPLHLKGDAVATARDYLSALRAAFEREGFELGQPSSLPAATAPVWLWWLVWLGATATGVGVLGCLFPMTHQRQWVVVGVLGTAGLALRWVAPLWAAKIGAFGLAVTAPLLAIWWGYQQTLRSADRWKRTASGVATCLTVLVACALMEAALLFDHRFWLKVDEFSGVKLSQLLPLLVVAALTLTQWWETAELPLRERWAVASDNLRALLAAPIRWGQAIGLLVAASVVAYWLMRTGNEPSVGVAAWELKLRALFEDVLIARPRFKEFLLGHPALVLAFFFLTGTHLEAKIGQWLLVPAVIGLASVMNTFSHAHSPIALSLLRTVHGIWLGVGLGVAIIGAMRWGAARRDRRVVVGAP